MTDWTLAFRQSQPLTTERWIEVIAAFVGGPVTTECGELIGNPRDSYSRDFMIRGQRGELQIAARLLQNLGYPADTAPQVDGVYITLSGPFREKIATWRDVRDALAAVGCTDYTLEYHGASIVDDIEAAGEIEFAARLREEIRSDLVERNRESNRVMLNRPRVDDIEAVLDAYPNPDQIVSVTLIDCGLQAIRSAFKRFPNVALLHLDDEAVDTSVICGVSLPKLQKLYLDSNAIRRIDKADLAGFPNLEVLSCVGTQLEELDLEIREVCPKLVRVMLDYTPFHRDAAKVAELQARWKGLKIGIWA